MCKKLKISAYILLICFFAMYASSCDFLLNRETPLESPVPQTTSTVILNQPLGQDGSIKPFFLSMEDDGEEPVRPLESYERIKGKIVSTARVRDLDDLTETAQKFRKPVFTVNSPLRPLYDKVLKVLNTIIQNYMTDYQRVLAIYDYISYYTLYDYELLEEFKEKDGKVSNPSDSAFSIKGVFNDRVAVCEGMSEAFSLMCSIEGIENVIIHGEAGEDSLPHAWNKVNLDGKWYAVDTTNASLPVHESRGYTEYHNHAYFLVSDSELGYSESAVLPGYPSYRLDDVKAEENYGFYEKEYIDGYAVSDGEISPEDIPKNYIFEDEDSLSDYLDYIKEKNFLNRNFTAFEIVSTQADVANYISMYFVRPVKTHKFFEQGYVYYIII